MRPSTPRWLLMAMRWTMASVSLALWKMDPFTSSRSRSCSWLVRLPLCATATAPRAYSTAKGCALRRCEPPAVE